MGLEVLDDVGELGGGQHEDEVLDRLVDVTDLGRLDSVVLPLRTHQLRRRKSGVSGGRDQPPVGGHRGGGQARDGVNLVLLVSLVGWVCSSIAQKEAKNSTATLSVDSFDAPCSALLKSWLVVARGASAPLQLVGHLGWVHQQEARAVGQPRERMGGRRERRTRAEISLSSHENHKARRGGSE